tara:strand:- start:270 stop:554 length:285 start_codon:yes stop_codon:yes gene_type:complete
MAKLKSGIATESLGNYVKALKTACGESASISVELVDEEIYYAFTAFDSCGEKFEAWTVWSWEYAKTAKPGELQVRLNETLSQMINIGEQVCLNV